MNKLPDSIEVNYNRRQYTIYADGIVYDNTPRIIEDIPPFIFKVRDLYLKEIHD